MKKVLAILSIVISSASAVSADSTNAISHLVLDTFSFFRVEGAEISGEVPIVSIPVRLSQASPSNWNIHIAPADFSLPIVEFADGSRVKWSLVSPASGQISFSSNSGVFELSGKFEAKSTNSSRAAIHDLSFTTGTSSLVLGPREVSRQGIPLDRRSGYLQMVATSSDPPGSSHGSLFYIVISGRLQDTPNGFLSQ
jgi:hypothetical protein